MPQSSLYRNPNLVLVLQMCKNLESNLPVYYLEVTHSYQKTNFLVTLRLHSNFPILGYDIGEKVCHPRRMLEKIHSVISFCCQCMPSCSFAKWPTKYVFNPICYCLSVVKAIIWTIIVCALDYSDLTKDLGFIVALEYISDAIIVSSTYLCLL